MKRQVYLITEKGHNFNREGSELITGSLDKAFGPAEDTVIISGPTYNKASTLASVLLHRQPVGSVNYRETCIAVSRGKGKNMTYLPEELVDETVRALQDPQFKGKTSWEILTEVTKGLGRDIGTAAEDTQNCRKETEW